MKALISPKEIVHLADGTTGQRVAEVHPTGFEVHHSLFWVECDNSVTADTHYWNGSEIVVKPLPPEQETVIEPAP